MKRSIWAGRRKAVITALGLAALLTLAASTRPDSASAVQALPGAEVSAADLALLVEAAKSCPALTPAKLAGQVMAASHFSTDPVNAVSAVGGSGMAGLTPQVWRKWAPWENARQTDKKASVIALAHSMCDLDGQLRATKVPGDRWRLALAAYRMGMGQVIKDANVPAGAREYVDTVERYALWYGLRPEFGGTGGTAAAAPPTDPPVTQAPLTPVPDQYVAAVVAAGKSCPEMPAPRIAAQIMATSGFDPQKLGGAGQQGIAQFLPQVWVAYVPPSGASPWNAETAVRALGTTMCAMIKERSKAGLKDAYPLALAAFQRGDSSIGTKADLTGSESLTALSGLVDRYQTEYAKDARLIGKPTTTRREAIASSKAPNRPDETPKATETAKAGTHSKPARTNQPPVKATDSDSGRVYGPYFIHNHGTGQCVDVPGTGPGKVDGEMDQNLCVTHAEDNQEFALVPRSADSAGNRLYWIRNIDDSLCLDPSGAGAPPNLSKLFESNCLDGDNQDWRLQKSLTAGKIQHYRIINASSGLCLDLPGSASAPNNTQLQLSICQGNDDNDWSLLEKSEF
ncbi:RICIN domain-containing protein [Actinoplanes sp. NPDC049265]|uniref:RICIN domain-containing protein n=1 Tax=Actinoplanes sp. NPDC049265 TaxID=3363902 RepID=UPI003712E13A